MTIDYNIRDEKREYDINREAAKISALSSGKIGKYEYLMGQEILPSNQRQIIEQSKFAYYPLRKTFEKQTKAIEDPEKKFVALKSLMPEKALKALNPEENEGLDLFEESFPKNMRTDEIEKGNR